MRASKRRKVKLEKDQQEILQENGVEEKISTQRGGRKRRGRSGEGAKIPERVDKVEATGCVIEYERGTPEAASIDEDEKDTKVKHRTESVKHGYVIIRKDKVTDYKFFFQKERK